MSKGYYLTKGYYLNISFIIASDFYQERFLFLTLIYFVLYIPLYLGINILDSFFKFTPIPRAF